MGSTKRSKVHLHIQFLYILSAILLISDISKGYFIVAVTICFEVHIYSDIYTIHITYVTGEHKHLDRICEK